jgi:hypothetical protein
MCPFSHSASFSLDVGMELIQQEVSIERCLQDQALERALGWSLEESACRTNMRFCVSRSLDYDS